MKIRLKILVTLLALVNGVFSVAPAVLHAQTTGDTIASKPETAAVLAPAEEPTIGTLPDIATKQSASASVADTFAFPTMLPETDLPVNMPALALYVLSAGINPLLAIVGLFLIIFLIRLYRPVPVVE